MVRGEDVRYRIAGEESSVILQDDDEPERAMLHERPDEAVAELRPGSKGRSRRVCPRWLADRQDDLVQMATMRTLEARRSAEGNPEVATSYLYRVAYTTLIDEIRRLRRRPEVRLEDAEGAGLEVPAPAPGPEQDYAAKEIGRAIAGLPASPPPAEAPRRGPSSPGAYGAGGGGPARVGRETNREPPLSGALRPTPLPGRQRRFPVSDALPDVERLRAALRALGEDAVPREDCPAPERIWGAVRAELPVAERREVVDHVAGCLSCAEAWRLAVEIDPDPRPMAAASTRPWLAAFFESRALVPLAATLLVATAAGVLLLRGPEGAHDPGYREAGPAAIRSLLPENEPVSRSSFRLRWSPGPEGSRYDVRVTTESLDPVASAQGLTEASFLVPEPLLVPLPAGSRLLWQVQMRGPEGNRQDSPTFVTLLR